MTLTIVHLYPRELGINGDVGNVAVLARRARAYGIDVKIVEVGRGDELPESADLVHVGSGPLSAVETVLPDAVRHTGRLRAWLAAGVPVLAIAGGWDLLGRRITTEDGRELRGLGLFPSTVLRTTRQAVDETVLQSPGGTIAGYVNHDGVTTLEDGASSFGQVVAGFGNGGASMPGTGLEGVVLGASVGTHLHGTVLAMNPLVADGLLVAALRRTTPNATLVRPAGEQGAWLERVDAWSRNAREALIRRTGADAQP